MAGKRDYYEILGLAREASDEDIRRAYRKIALENHPDRNPGDHESEQRFKDAAQAYSVLCDRDKRARYDQFGHAGVNGAGPSFHNTEEIFSAFADIFGGGGGGIFESFFGGRRGVQRGASLRVDLELTLEEVATGVQKTIEIARPERCENCSGSGARPGTTPRPCATCGGHGQVVRTQSFLSIRQTCPACQGQGTVITEHCGKCKGRGLVARKVPINIKVPAGIEEGHVERISGQGEPGAAGAPPGDLVVVIHVQPHEVFTRQEDDLLAQLRIRFRQAVLGDTIDVPTITGETVSLKIPPGTQPGERLRVRHHGLPRGDGYGRGNLVIQIQIEVPKAVNSEQEDWLKLFDEMDQKKAPKKPGKKKSLFEKVKDAFR